MSEVLQSGLHPDADQLSAFVEHALPAGERERTLAHLAVCPRCRAVVALSLPPVGEPATSLSEPARGRWFSGWNLVWSTAVALSATILITVYAYRAATNRSAPAQVAASRPVPQPAAPAGPSGSIAAGSSNRQPVGPSSQNSQEKATTATSRSAASAQRQQSMEANAFTSQNLAVSAAPSAMEREALNSENMLKTTGRENEAKKNAPTAAFGVAGMEALSETQAQTSLPPGSFQSDRKIVAGAAAKPMAKAAAPLRAASPPPPALGTGNETVALANAAAPGIASSEAAEAPTMEEEPVLQLQSPEYRLPSRLPVVSMAAHERLALAIDAHNAVFVSNDAGKHWKAVRAPWMGRAVTAALISTADAGAPASWAMQTRTAGALFSGETPPAGSANGSLSGMVMDATGAVIPGASVVVVHSTSRAARAAKTDSTGRFVVRGLAPGAYDVKAAAPGFRPTQLARVTVAAAGESVANLSLPVGMVTQSIMVAPAPPAAPMDGLSATSKPSAQAPPGGEIPVLFEITTDSGEHWTSADGLTWARK